MEKKKLIFWYIFTNDSHTNEVISREVPREDTLDGVKCSDGVKRKLWKCDGTFVTKMFRNKDQQNLHFEVFKKEGKYGKIRRADFFDKKRKK
jgi:hypothetical protein